MAGEKQAQLQCVKCQQPFIAIIKNPMVMNQEVVSIACWAHETPVACTNCGQQFQFMIKEIGTISFAFIPVEAIAPPEERLILAPSPSDVEKLKH